MIIDNSKLFQVIIFYQVIKVYILVPECSLMDLRLNSSHYSPQLPYMHSNQIIFRQPPSLTHFQQQTLIQNPNYNVQRPVSMVINLDDNIPQNSLNTNRPKSFVEASLNKKISLEDLLNNENYQEQSFSNNLLEDDGIQVNFLPICRYEDLQAIRAVAFHPSGRYFAIGTNSKQMIICKYPDLRKVRYNY